MIIEGNTIIADPGKVLMNKYHEIVGKEHGLGYLYYINGVKLDEPILETASDFIEVSEVVLQPIIDTSKYPQMVDEMIRVKYSLSDELAIQRQRDTKPEQFKEYFEFCEECKRRAKEELGITD